MCVLIISHTGIVSIPTFQFYGIKIALWNKTFFNIMVIFSGKQRKNAAYTPDELE